MSTSSERMKAKWAAMSPEERKAQTDRLMAARKAKKKAPDAPPMVDAAIPHIEEPTISTPEKKGVLSSLGDRLRGMLDGSAAPAEKVSESDSKKLIDQVVGFAALWFMMGMENLIFRHPYYKPCAPNEVESKAILYPIANIIARYAKITGTLSPTALDITMCIMAMNAYGWRAVFTAQQITQEVIRANSNQQRPTGPSGPLNAPSAGMYAPDSMHNVNPPFQRQSNGPSDVPADGTGSAGQYPTNGKRSTGVIADLLAQDAEGRRRLGI